jgi:hypothetical protein
MLRHADIGLTLNTNSHVTLAMQVLSGREMDEALGEQTLLWKAPSSLGSA